MRAHEALEHLAQFGTPPNSKVARTLSVGLDVLQRHFCEEILPFVARGGADIQFVAGEYGRGKTHLLRVLADCARERGFAVAYIECNGGNAPFASMQETYRQIASSIRHSEPLYQGHPRLGLPVLIETALAGVSWQEAEGMLERVAAEQRLPPDFRNLVLAYGRRVLHAAPGDDLLRALRALLVADRLEMISVSKLYKEYPSLPRPIGKLMKRNAPQWLRGLAVLPRLLGCPGLLVLFDETEPSYHAGKQVSARQRIHLANIRNLIDHIAVGDLPGCVMRYAVVEDFLQHAKTALGALAQRIEPVSLPNIGNQPNMRAVWVTVDDLTSPNPSSPAFFLQLADRLLALVRDVDFELASSLRLRNELRDLALAASEGFSAGRVREFVKAAATVIYMEIA